MFRVVKFFSFILFAYGIVDIQAQDLENIKKQDPFSIRGSVGVEFTYYNAVNKPSSYDPFTYRFSGNPVISIYGFELPFAFHASNRGNKFSQPFSTFGVSPKYKWITAHAGYRSLNFSSFSLGGQLILGGGLELNPGRFRFGIIGGRFQKAVDPDTASSSYAAFKRVGFAAKIGYGTEKNYVDVILLKGRDRENSIDSIPPDIRPGENVVFALKTYQKIPGGLFVEGEWAHSLYARDVRLAEQDGNNLLGTVLPFLITERANTVGRNAIEARAGYEMDVFGIAATFRRIDPEFESMGAYFFQDDVMSITVDPTIYLMQKKLTLSGSIGFERDNLDENKTATTKRLIGSANVDLSLQKYMLSIGFSNYGITQSDLATGQDSLYQIDQVNRDVTMNHSLIFTSEKVSHIVNLFGQYMQASDRNESDFIDISYNNLGGNSLYVLSLLKPGTSISAGASVNRFEQDTLTNMSYGPNYGLTQQLLKKQMTVSLSHSIQWTRFMETNQNISHRIRFGASYRIKRQHNISVKCNVHRVNALVGGASDFTEIKASLGYEYKFNYTKKRKQD